MIYFEFEICPEGVTTPTDSDVHSAEFVFDSDNAAECTRRAATLLRSRGWRPMSVKHAKEAYRAEDFADSRQTLELYRRAEVAGVGYRIYEPVEVAETQVA